MSEPREPSPSAVGPWTFIVTWGVLLRPGWHSMRVEAYDAEEALVLAAELHPELPRPRTAYLARQDP